MARNRDWRRRDTARKLQRCKLDDLQQQGAEVSGTFKCSYAGNCHFAGVKVPSRPADGHVDPEAQWLIIVRLLMSMREPVDRDEAYWR
jgi:hypothetical protein